MSHKNETLALLIAFFASAGIVGVMLWLITSQFSIFSNILQPSSPSSTTSRSFETVSEVPEGLFSYGGSTTWAPIRKVVDPEIQVAKPQFQLRYTHPTTGTPGSGEGIELLLKDQLAFSQSSRSVKTKE